MVGALAFSAEYNVITVVKFVATNRTLALQLPD
jgi:hypothetical protein